MNPDTLIASLKDHLDSLQTITGWTVFLALGIAWGGLQKDDEITIGDLKLNRRDAFIVATAVYLVASISFLLLLGRIHALLESLPREQFVEGYTTVAAHSWLLNPFAYLGESAPASLSTRLSVGLLILSWWLCVTSVVVLRDFREVRRNLFLPILFYAAGLLSLWLIYAIYQLNLSRLQPIASDIYDGIKATADSRWTAIFVSVPVGIAVFILTLVYQKRRHAAN